MIIEDRAQEENSSRFDERRDFAKEDLYDVLHVNTDENQAS
jgi:hypothetical protein